MNMHKPPIISLLETFDALHLVYPIDSLLEH